jgi:ATP-dependent RNA helicase HelY
VLADAVARARSLEGRIKTLESREGLNLMRQVDTGFMQVVHDWASGEELEYMASTYPQYSAGDFVRSMKQVVDIMRQIKEVAEDPVLARKVSQAMDLVNRSIIAYTSVVDAMEEDLEITSS